MKSLNVLKIAALTMALALSSCASKKKVVDEPKPLTPEQQESADFIGQVHNNAQTARFLTSKVKFSVEVGAQKLTLTGNLKMKRDDVIRLQLMAFGFVEAGRIELTKDYVLIMDRINKQYLKAPYVQVDFLRNSGLNFSSMQALFWNELFKPSVSTIATRANANDTVSTYSIMETGSDVVISLEQDNMSYSWLATQQNPIIKMANILYKNKVTQETTQLNWDYEDFVSNNSKLFPKKHTITLTTQKKEVKLGMTLNYLSSETDWETRTEVSNKYREVTVDEILRRFMSL